MIFFIVVIIHLRLIFGQEILKNTTYSDAEINNNINVTEGHDVNINYNKATKHGLRIGPNDLHIVATGCLNECSCQILDTTLECMKPNTLTRIPLLTDLDVMKTVTQM